MGAAETRRQRKKDLVYVMGGKCIVCGYDTSIKALEFHHIDPNSKNFQLSSGNSRSWQKDIEEVKKCALLCSNCHKSIEDIPTEEIFNTFNEERYQEILERKRNTPSSAEEYEKKKNLCQVCGVEISPTATKCCKCQGWTVRKAERPERDELKELVYTQPFITIAKMFDVSDNAVRKWCKSYNLPSTKSEIKNYNDEEWRCI